MNYGVYLSVLFTLMARSFFAMQIHQLVQLDHDLKKVFLSTLSPTCQNLVKEFKAWDDQVLASKTFEELSQKLEEVDNKVLLYYGKNSQAQEEEVLLAELRRYIYVMGEVLNLTDWNERFVTFQKNIVEYRRFLQRDYQSFLDKPESSVVIMNNEDAWFLSLGLKEEAWIYDPKKVIRHVNLLKKFLKSEDYNVQKDQRIVVKNSQPLFPALYRTYA